MYTISCPSFSNALDSGVLRPGAAFDPIASGDTPAVLRSLWGNGDATAPDAEQYPAPFWLDSLGYFGY